MHLNNKIKLRKKKRVCSAPLLPYDTGLGVVSGLLCHCLVFKKHISLRLFCIRISRFWSVSPSHHPLSPPFLFSKSPYFHDIYLFIYLFIYLLHSPPLILIQSLSLNLELINLASLTGLQAPEICPSLPSQHRNYKRSRSRAEEMNRWLRALAAFPEDLGSIPPTYTLAHNCL